MQTHLKVLIVHNYYQQPGGEDQVVAAETALLEKYGHEVLQFTVHNDQVKGINPITLALNTIWNHRIYREVRETCCKMSPDVMHVHNTLPILSPAVYYAANAEGVPVIQTLHNYRLFCPGAYCFSNGTVCEACKGKIFPVPAMIRACYRNSVAATTVVSLMLFVHRLLKTYSRRVDLYIALTDFAKSKFIEGGLSAEKIVVKPNFIGSTSDTGEIVEYYALFVGRLSPEKGVRTLLQAWETVGDRLPLKILGDGPMHQEVIDAAQRNKAIVWLGRQPRETVLDLMKRAYILVFPSEWYEGFPMTIAEAYSVGLPVVAGNLGAMQSIIKHGCTGLHFEPGDSGGLAEQVLWTIDHRDEMHRMRHEARKEYENFYTGEINYRLLMDAYNKAGEINKHWAPH